MSESKAPEEKGDGAKGDAKGAKGGLPVPLIGAAAGALILGSVLGIFVLAPRIVAMRGGTPAEAASAEAGKEGEKGGHEKPAKKEKGEHGKGGHGEKAGGESAVHKIENLIVNPAGSQGRRFLMLTVAIEVPDDKTETTLREHDAQLRDAIIGALETQPLSVITSVGGRDSVRAAIVRVVTPMVEDAEFVNVYLPQFVLQ